METKFELGDLVLRKVDNLTTTAEILGISTDTLPCYLVPSEESTHFRYTKRVEDSWRKQKFNMNWLALQKDEFYIWANQCDLTLKPAENIEEIATQLRKEIRNAI